MTRTMHTTRAGSASDSRSSSAKQLDAYREPVPDGPGTLEVYVLHVQPDGMDGFVLDVYGSRAQAAVDKAVIEDEETAVSIRAHRVETAERPRLPAGR